MVPFALVFVAGLMAGLASHGAITRQAQAGSDNASIQLLSQPASKAAPGTGLGTYNLGTYNAEITRIIDGDTVEARVAVWMGQDVVTKVRLRGIDAPEIGGSCAPERDQAVAARNALDSLIGNRPVMLAEIGPDKYFGRVVARLMTADGHDAGAALLARRLARPYAGKRRESWCALP